MLVGRKRGAAVVLDGGTRAARGAVSIWFTEPGGENRDVKILNGGAAEAGGANTVAAPEAGLSAKHGLAKMIFAIPDPPRPWHRRGSVTRDSLRDVLRNPSRSTVED